VIIDNLREDNKIEKDSRCEIVLERSVDGWENINMVDAYIALKLKIAHELDIDAMSVMCF
jgi:hypothetical protein